MNIDDEIESLQPLQSQLKTASYSNKSAQTRYVNKSCALLHHSWQQQSLQQRNPSESTFLKSKGIQSGFQ